MEKYPFEWVDGHLITEIGGRTVLFDTGSPVGIGRGTLEIGPVSHELQRVLGDVDIDGLADMVGHPIEVLMGEDIIRQYDLHIHERLKRLELDTDTSEFDGVALPTKSANGVPVVEMEMWGAPRRMFFDTGANLSYMKVELIEDLPVAGRKKDFYPPFVTFETDVREVPARIAGTDTTLQCGVLPAGLEKLYEMGPADGIVGTELLKRFVVFLAKGAGPLKVMALR